MVTMCSDTQCTPQDRCYPCYLDEINGQDDSLPPAYSEDELDDLADRADRNWLRHLEG